MHLTLNEDVEHILARLMTTLLNDETMFVQTETLADHSYLKTNRKVNNHFYTVNTCLQTGSSEPELSQ